MFVLLVIVVTLALVGFGIMSNLLHAVIAAAVLVTIARCVRNYRDFGTLTTPVGPPGPPTTGRSAGGRS